jgi:hypothetical protein
MIGAATRKMMRSTSITSTSGVMLISDLSACSAEPAFMKAMIELPIGRSFACGPDFLSGDGGRRWFESARWGGLLATPR